MRILRTKEFSDVHVRSGYTFTAKVTDPFTGKEICSVSETFDEPRIINKIVVFETEDMFGMSNVIGAAFGYSP